MQCTVKKTLKEVKASKNDAIVQVKKNQKKLLKECEKVELEREAEDIYEERPEKGHGRIEKRKTKVYKMEAWDGLIESLAVVDRKTKVFNNRKQVWEERFERSYYVITCYLSGREANEGIRNHWHIENRENWVKDVSMGEDACKIKKNAETMGKLRTISLNQLRKKEVSNIRQALTMNARDIKRAFNYF